MAADIIQVCQDGQVVFRGGEPLRRLDQVNLEQVNSRANRAGAEVSGYRLQVEFGRGRRFLFWDRAITKTSTRLLPESLMRGIFTCQRTLFSRSELFVGKAIGGSASA